MKEELEEARYDYMFKIILVGDSNVGKSCLLTKYTKGVFPTSPLPTIAVEFATKTIKVKNRATIKAQIWDTAGQEKYKSITSYHYRKAVGALLVYDVTKKSTFVNVQKWLLELRQFAEPDCTIVLVGNKVDLVNKNQSQREITHEEVKTFAHDNNLLFYETSALSNENVNQAFENLLQEILNSKEKEMENITAAPVGYNATGYGLNHSPSLVKVVKNNQSSASSEGRQEANSKCCG